jgi:hypothetical protein
VKGIHIVKVPALITIATLMAGCSSMAQKISMDDPIPGENGLVAMSAYCKSPQVQTMAVSSELKTMSPEQLVRCGKPLGINFGGIKLFSLPAGDYYIIGQGGMFATTYFAYEVTVEAGKINYFGYAEAVNKAVVKEYTDSRGRERTDVVRQLTVSVTDRYEEDLKALKEEYPDYPWNYEVVMSVPEKEYDIAK